MWVGSAGNLAKKSGTEVTPQCIFRLANDAIGNNVLRELFSHSLLIFAVALFVDNDCEIVCCNWFISPDCISPPSPSSTLLPCWSSLWFNDKLGAAIWTEAFVENDKGKRDLKLSSEINLCKVELSVCFPVVQK